MAKPQVALLLPCKGSILQGKVPRPALLGPVARKGPRRKSNPNPGGHSCRWGGATGSSAGAKLSRRDVLRASGVAMASMSLPLSCFSSAAQAVGSPAFPSSSTLSGVFPYDPGIRRKQNDCSSAGDLRYRGPRLPATCEGQLFVSSLCVVCQLLLPPLLGLCLC